MTATAERATAAWIARQVPKRGTGSSSGGRRAGGRFSFIEGTGATSARAGHYATIPP